jgi:cell division septation protein DedD
VTSAPATAAPSGPVEAQLAANGDQRSAEALAARLINKGFTSAYVERATSDKGTLWKVRVKFNSEAEATAALPRLKEFSKDIWITR